MARVDRLSRRGLLRARAQMGTYAMQKVRHLMNAAYEEGRNAARLQIITAAFDLTYEEPSETPSRSDVDLGAVVADVLSQHSPGAHDGPQGV